MTGSDPDNVKKSSVSSKLASSSFKHDAQPLPTSCSTRKCPRTTTGNNDILVALPQEIRELIIQKVDLVDYHRLSAVCKLWRSIAIAAAEQSQGFSLQRQLPWLVLSSDKYDSPDGHHGFFSLCHGKIFNLKLPEIRGARCCGSSWGWLIMADKVGDNFLLHPFSRARIELPSQTTIIFPLNPFDDWAEQRRKDPLFIRKAMLLSPPIASSSDCCTATCFVVALYARSALGFCRPGDKAWTVLSESLLPVILFEDIIYYKGHLYGVDLNYDLLHIELNIPHRPRATKLNIPCPVGYDPLNQRLGHSIYLVESCGGDLLIVVRFWKPSPDLRISDLRWPPYSTAEFAVFKLDPICLCWVKVKSLGDDGMLFVGTSSSVFVRASYFSGFKGNRIYFTDDNFTIFRNVIDFSKPCCDIGVFSLEDGSINSFFPPDSHSPRCPPIWFMPSSLK